MRLDQQILEPEKIVIPAQKEVAKEVKYLGKLKLQRGQKFWKLDLKTRMVSIVELNKATVNLKGETRRQHFIEENCLYTVAINLKNAEKKFIKMLQK